MNDASQQLLLRVHPPNRGPPSPLMVLRCLLPWGKADLIPSSAAVCSLPSTCLALTLFPSPTAQLRLGLFRQKSRDKPRITLDSRFVPKFIFSLLLFISPPSTHFRTVDRIPPSRPYLPSPTFPASSILHQSRGIPAYPRLSTSVIPSRQHQSRFVHSGPLCLCWMIHTWLPPR